LFRRWLGSRTLRYLVAHAPCQVLVGYAPAAGAPWATQQFLLVRGADRDHAAGNVLDHVTITGSGRGHAG
jgi:hypothetical protein